MRRFLSRRQKAVGSRQERPRLLPTAYCLLPSGGAALFVAFTAVVATRLLDSFDWNVLLALRAVGDQRLEDWLSVFSYLTAAEASVAIGVVWAIALWRAGYGWGAVAPLLFLLSVPVEFALKLGLDHPSVPRDLYRPGLGYGLLTLSTENSYPSGYATRGFFFGALAWLQAGQLGGSATWLVRAILVAVEALMAANRIYLGIHWTTDVFGGWLLGFTIAMLAGAVMSAGRSLGTARNRGEGAASSAPTGARL